MRKILTGIVLALVALPNLFAQGADKIILKVNNRSFTEKEYFQRMEFLNDVYMAIDGGFLEAPPGFITLLRMINDELILELARQKGVMPTEGEIDSEFAKRKQGNAELFAEMEAIGISEAELKLRATIDLAQFKLLTMGVTVTDEQVDEHYKANPQLYTVPGILHLRVIVVKDEAAKAAVDEALKTKPFGEVAQEHSVDATKAIGGDLGVIPIGNLPERIQQQFKDVPVGKTTDWIESSGSWLKYFVEEKTETTIKPLTPELRETIRKRLMLEIGKQKNRLQDDLDALRASAKIEFSNPGMKTLYERYMKEYFRSAGGGSRP
ncbi:MAG: hypothetical protein KatS3mg015_0262 [Fimbriimonadales bacterium]|nr:MAG: hypothetical protein KatS3mg015_0262 [Fimbriimonadales bacterium]